MKIAFGTAIVMERSVRQATDSMRILSNPGNLSIANAVVNAERSVAQLQGSSRRRFPRRGCLSARQLSKMLNQQFGKNSDFPCGVLTRRPDDEHAGRRDGIARHHLDKGTGIQTILDEVIRKPRDAEPRHRGSGESGTVIRFELPLRMNGNCLVAIEKLPSFPKGRPRRPGLKARDPTRAAQQVFDHSRRNA
jgi:hypothetical protein